MLYDKYKEGAIKAVSTFVTNKSPKGAMVPVTANSHILNSHVDPLATRPQIPDFFNQQDRATSLAQESMNANLKLGLDQSKLCTTCKKAQHYGACNHLLKPHEKSLKEAQFNRGMYGNDSLVPLSENNYTQSNNNSGKLNNLPTAVDPAMQTNTAFKTFEEAYSSLVADESERSIGDLNKTANITVNPYEERPQNMKPWDASLMNTDDQLRHIFKSLELPQEASSAEYTAPESGPLI